MHLSRTICQELEIDHQALGFLYRPIDIVKHGHGHWAESMLYYVIKRVNTIREIPDHATFRENEHTHGWLDKLGGFLSLALCNLTNFDQL